MRDNSIWKQIKWLRRIGQFGGTPKPAQDSFLSRFRVLFVYFDSVIPFDWTLSLTINV